MARLFEPFKLRDVLFRNRLVVSPMCQYSCVDGMPHDWHLVHLGSRAVGGAGMVIAEATGVSPEGRISPACAGIWNDEQASAWRRIAHFIKAHGAVPAIQLAHAGRKASPSWTVVAPSALAFDATSPLPVALDDPGIQKVADDFAAAAGRAVHAGFEAIEIHAAHGYLLHEFLSPLSNHRQDRWGGSFENRTRLLLAVTAAVRAILPEGTPLLVRISATDWMESQGESWDLEQSIQLARLLKASGVDLVDVSSGGLSPLARVPAGPLFQVPFAERIRREAGIATSAVGLIDKPEQAEAIITEGRAEMVQLGRAMLSDPYFPLHAAKALGHDVPWPRQYGSAKT